MNQPHFVKVFMILYFLLIALSVSLSPHIYTLAADEKFERLTAQEGLGFNTVSCIMQDSKGFIWFGTLEGLSRFNSCTFDRYKNDPADPQSLRSNEILSLCEDHQGGLWGVPPKVSINITVTWIDLPVIKTFPTIPPV